jgi:hypothetical protein
MKRLTYSLALLIIVASPYRAFGQERERTLKWQADPPLCPIIKGGDGKTLPSDIKALEIIKITVSKKPVAVGQSFSADDDWMRDLEVRVRNTSGMPIASASMGLNLPEAKYGNGILGVSLTWKGGSKRQLVEPGEEFTLSRAKEVYERNQRWVAETSGVTSISLVWVSSTGVIFGDGTWWGGYARMSNEQVQCMRVPAA